MRNRWYSPRLGQFISHDPLHYIDSTNMYAFAAFDPINSWDPLGLESGGLAPTNNTDEASKQPEQPVHPPGWRPDDPIYDYSEGCDSNASCPDETARKQVELNQRRDSRVPIEPSLIQLDDLLGGPALLKAGAKALLVAGRVAGSKLLAKQAAKQLPKAAAKVCSFTEDTPVLMCDGSLRAIQEVEEGEWVLAQNEETGEVSCRQVVAPYDNPGSGRTCATVHALFPDSLLIFL